ncbi:MAG: MoaD/ThiS family protein [Lysobacterales bacterium]
MKVTLKVFGYLREYVPEGALVLELAEDARVGALRQQLAEHARAHWPGFAVEGLRACAFASEHALLREDEALPADGQLAILPPVSGG